MKAEVYSSNTREIGWREVDISFHILTSNMNLKQTVFHWHGDTFDLPKNTIRIASNDAFENQAFTTKNGFVVGTQFHFETNEESIKSILKADIDYLSFNSEFIQDIETINKNNNHIKSANLALFSLLDIWKEL